MEMYNMRSNDIENMYEMDKMYEKNIEEVIFRYILKDACMKLYRM